MGKKVLEEILRKKHQIKEKQGVDWNRRRNVWLNSVEAFYRDIVTWLEPFTEKGLLEITCEDAVKREEHIGEYHLKKMILSISEETVVFDPVGTLIIGAWGRIDMTGRNGTIMFVLADRGSDGPRIRMKTDTGFRENNNPKSDKEPELGWKISTSPPDMRYIPLNEDSFSDVLAEVIHD